MPPSTAPTPSAAPAAAPAAPSPAPAPQATPSGPSSASQSSPAPSRSTAFDGIDDIEGTDSIDTGGSPAAPTTGLPATTADTTPKPDTQTPPTAEPKKAGLGDDLDPLLGKAKASGTPKELRSAYEKTTSELAQAKAKLAEFEKQIGSVKSEAEKAVASKIEELTGKLSSYEQKLQLLDFRSSETFQREYAQPADAAWQQAAAALRGVKVENADGSERPISAQDIMEMVVLDPADAWSAAQKFGTHAPLIHRHVEAIREKEAAKQNAVKEWGEKGKAHHEQLQREQESMRQDWEAGTEEIMQQRAQDLGIADPTPEVKALLDHGAKLAKIAFLGGADRTQVLQAQKLAAVRVRTFGAVLNRATTAEARVAELDAKLAQYEAGDPPIGGAGVPAGGSGAPRTAEDGIDAIDGYESPG